jgi:hypothetical protein
LNRRSGSPIFFFSSACETPCLELRSGCRTVRAAPARYDCQQWRTAAQPAAHLSYSAS